MLFIVTGKGEDMLEFLRSWIINIVTISIVLILFEIIIPTGKVKKIVNLVSGFILIIAVINPFLALKNKDFDLGESVIADSFYIDKKEVEAGSKLLQDTQMKQISDVYKKKLVSKIEEELKGLKGVSDVKAQVEINQDYNSEKFGEITMVTVEVKKGAKQKEDTEIEPVASVKKVDITAPKKADTPKSGEAVGAEDKKLMEQVKENLNKTLEINKDSIRVTIA